MLEALKHLPTTIAGVLAGALTAWAALPGLEGKPLLDQLKLFGGCLAIAAVGVLSTGTKKPDEPKQ